MDRAGGATGHEHTISWQENTCDAFYHAEGNREIYRVFNETNINEMWRPLSV